MKYFDEYVQNPHCCTFQVRFERPVSALVRLPAETGSGVVTQLLPGPDLRALLQPEPVVHQLHLPLLQNLVLHQLQQTVT